MNTQTNPSVNQAMGLTQWGLLLFLSLIWGGSFFFVGVAVKEVPPFTVVLSRVGLASLILLAVIRLRGERIPVRPGIWGAFFIMGALNNAVPFCLIAWGQTHIQSGMASILNATTPIFSVILAHFFTREERMTGNRLAGVVLGWAGVAVLMGGASSAGGSREILGQTAVLGAAFAYAWAAVFGRRFKEMSPLVVAFGMLAASTVMMMPLAVITDQPWQLSISPQTAWALAGLAAVSTSLAYLIYFRILATSGPTNLLLVTFLIPVSAVFLGAVFLDERLGPSSLAGMVMICGGLIGIDGRLPARVYAALRGRP